MKRTSLVLILVLALLISVIAGIQFIEFGKASAVPVQTVQSSASTRQFDVDLLYAYIQGGSHFIGTVVFNVTRVSDVPLSSEGMIEVYKVEVFADGLLIGYKAVSWQIGKGLSMDIRMNFAMSLHSFYTTTEYGLQDIAIPINRYLQEPFNLVEPVSVSIKRLGWITVDGDSVHSNLLVNETMQQVQLEAFGNGFLYNALVPTEELPQMDPFHPLDMLNPNSPSPSPSPSQEPTSSQKTEPEPFPTALVTGVIVSVAVIGIGLLVYLKKQRRGGNP